MMYRDRELLTFNFFYGKLYKRESKRREYQ